MIYFGHPTSSFLVFRVGYRSGFGYGGSVDIQLAWIDNHMSPLYVFRECSALHVGTLSLTRSLGFPYRGKYSFSKTSHIILVFEYFDQV